MTCHIVGKGCVQGPECNPRYPARPVAYFGYCFFCWGNLGVKSRIAAREKFAADQEQTISPSTDQMAA